MSVVAGPITGVKVSGPSGLLFAGNSSANLSCGAEAGEVTTVTWKKDGKALSAGGRVLIAADKKSIRIDPLQKDDNGQFVCELSNQVDNQAASFKMVVNCESYQRRRPDGGGAGGPARSFRSSHRLLSSSDGPEKPTVTGQDAVEVNDEVTLTCSASSVPPANFTWRFNGSETSTKTATFVIAKAVFKNTGTYTCEAHNAVTGRTEKATHSLSVKGEPQPGVAPARRRPC